MMTPGPDHPITLTTAKTRYRAKFAGHVIADSDDALLLKEASLPQVVYFPRGDVGMEYMSRTDRSTHCPYKGDAAYYTLLMDGQMAENVAWSYEAPYPAMDLIGNRIAFYADKVEVYAVDDEAVNPQRHREDDEASRASVDEVVKHTDSGAGISQAEHWAPNVETPPLSDDPGLR